jgi:hypothetical protein
MTDVAAIFGSSPAVFDQGWERLEALFPASEPEVREDLSLCFVCLRWTSGDHCCRTGAPCELQREPGVNTT